MVVGEWFPWQRTGRGCMAPGVNRWPMFPHTEVRHCVTFSLFVITNADWTSRHYLVLYLIVVGNGYETSRKIVHCSMLAVPSILAFEPIQYCHEKLQLLLIINWQDALNVYFHKSWSCGELHGMRNDREMTDKKTTGWWFF